MQFDAVMFGKQKIVKWSLWEFEDAIVVIRY